MTAYSAFSLGFYLQQDYVQYALIVAPLIALCSALLGVCLVLRRYSLIGDGLSHVTFGTMAAAAVTGIAEMYISLPVTVLTAVLLLCTGERSKVRGDASIAMISVGSLGVAYLLFNQFGDGNSAQDVCKVLFGNTTIISLKLPEVLLSVALAVAVLLFYSFFYHKIFAVTFDASFAQATGVRANLYNLAFAIVTGVVIVLATKLVGALLITALIVFPTVSAMRLFRSFRSVAVCAAVISVICSVAGVLLSLLASFSAGSSIVVANLIVFVLSSLISIIFRRKKV